MDSVVQFVMPTESEAKHIPDGHFQEGETVVYHSRTHSGYLRTRITKIHSANGVVQAIDLACKKSADMTKIAKIQDSGPAECEGPPRKQRGNVLTELPSPLHVENAEMLLDGQRATAKPQKAAENQVKDMERSAPHFNVGDTVYYYSKTHGQKILAKVEAITPEGHYDLDVKRCAHACNISPYVEEACHPPLAYSMPPQPLHDDAAPKPMTRVVLPLQKVYVGTDGIPATDCSAATPIGFNIPSTTPMAYSTPYGEGQLVSCKISAAVPLVPRPKSPASNRTPGPSPSSFFPGGVTPKAATPKAQTPAQAAATAELVNQLKGELRVGQGFDPRRPEIRSQLLALLKLPAGAHIQEMSGFKGGLNLGIWLVSGGQDLVLKQVRCFRVASNVLTEAENFIRIVKEHPEIVNDPLVAFPVKILSCIGAEGKLVSDLIVMRRSRGERLCEYVATKFYAGQVPQLRSAVEQVGQALARFHQRYANQQHGDFQPSNIYYDEKTKTVFFIDVGGMGVPTTGNDLEHFHQCMRSMTTGYKPDLHVELLQAFDKGYQSCPSSSRLQQGFGMAS
mmetsp:Transcript_15553/g.36654  ORF Transcript_15553/g.36654 Transcript_15553/m.36654 type:complete len:564 (-) Transcript_15553:68-1759(-)